MDKATETRREGAPTASKLNGQAMLGWVLHHIVWIWLIALVVIFGVFNEFFLTISNLQNVMVQATVLGTLGLAVALPLLVAEIDLSIPANAGFSAAVGALAYAELGLPWPIAALMGLLVGTFIGFFNGVCITRLKMVSLIETLAMMIIIQGALLALTQGKTLTNLSEGYIWIGQATIGGWPLMPVVFLLVLAVMGAVLKYTVLGRSIYAVGGNPVASNSAGIRVARVKNYCLHDFRVPCRTCWLFVGIVADGHHLKPRLELLALRHRRAHYRRRQCFWWAR